VYRQRLPNYPLSIEEGTEGLPADGWFYVIHDGATVGRFRSLSQAQKAYKGIKDTLDLAPVEAPPPNFADIRRREMDAMSNKSILWTDEDFNRVDRKTKGRPKH